MENIYLLPKKLSVNNKLEKKVETDYKHFIDQYPDNVEDYILDEYQLDISSYYGSEKIKNPFGKASGQLSSNINLVKKDLEAGLGFVVLKTVISEDKKGSSKMKDWKVDSPEMKVERIRSQRGESGWTVTWKGKGWSKSFDDYIEFVTEALKLGSKVGVPVIPSCQYQLPDNKIDFDEKEYRYTTSSLIKAWKKVYSNRPLLLEQDLSPTLLDNTLKSKKQFYKWLREVPVMIKDYADNNILLGLKLLNTPYEDSFQVEILNYLFDEDIPLDWLIVFNRLFDSDKVFKGKKGVAYGGYDLSDRNLRVLTEFRQGQKDKAAYNREIPLSATGNINSGKMMVEYALRGCKNGQIHTFFQLPVSEYAIKKGSHTKRALHELLFNPDHGLLITMLYLREKYGLAENGVLKFTQITELYKEYNLLKYFR